ncbi:MAG: MarR family winged helix-turn-helix transcriptional regulator [Anaerotardibacter sp.]
MNNRFEHFATQFSRIRRSYQRIRNQEMAAFGLKGAHVSCLTHLEQNPQGLTVAELSALCVEDKAAISRTVHELEDKNLVEKAGGSGSVGYRSIITLTDEGKEICTKIMPIIDDFVEKATHGLDEETLESFRKALFHIANNLDS